MSFIDKVPKIFIKTLISKWILDIGLANLQMTISEKTLGLHPFFDILEFDDTISSITDKDQLKINWIICNNLKYYKLIIKKNLDVNNLNITKLKYLHIEFKHQNNFCLENISLSNNFPNLEYFSVNVEICNINLHIFKLIGNKLTTLKIYNNYYTAEHIIEIVKMFPNLTILDITKNLKDKNEICCFDHIISKSNNFVEFYIKNDTISEISNLSFKNNNLKNVRFNFKNSNLPNILNNFKNLTIGMSNYFNCDSIDYIKILLESIKNHQLIKKITLLNDHNFNYHFTLISNTI